VTGNVKKFQVPPPQRREVQRFTYVTSTLTVEELETNLMSLVMFITLNICSTYFEH